MTTAAATAGRAVGAETARRQFAGRWTLLATMGAVLLAACVFQFLPTAAPARTSRAVPLSEYFPRTIAGWVGQDRPLGETEAVSKAAKKLLDYDEAFQRVYRKDGREFVLYVAYWHAGKKPSREIAFHVPDICWVGVGWKRTAANYHCQIRFEGRDLAPAQYREFDAPGDHEHVWFWHILDGKAIFYSPDGPPSQWTTLKSVFHRGLSQKGEQYFIRISSQLSPKQLWGDDGFQAMMELVAPLGPGLSSDLAHF